MKPLVIILPLLLALAGCGRAEREFVVGVEGGYAPWTIIDRDNGEFHGFDVELAQATCAKLGLKPSFKAIQWADKKRALEAGEIDCVWSGFYLNGRKDDYAILGPYMTGWYVFVVRTDSGIRNFRDLDGKVAGCQRGSTMERTLEDIVLDQRAGRRTELPKELRIVKSDYYEAVVNQLKRDIIDTAMFDIDFAGRVVKRSRGELMIVPGPKINEDEVGAGFRRDDVATRDQFAKALGELVREGKVKPLMKKYFGNDERWIFKPQ